jgi:hypothetical protein
LSGGPSVGDWNVETIPGTLYFFNDLPPGVRSQQIEWSCPDFCREFQKLGPCSFQFLLASCDELNPCTLPGKPLDDAFSDAAAGPG